ncbi:MAG TPA: type II secretion system protein GspC [Kofleriaceae bacterium]
MRTGLSVVGILVVSSLAYGDPIVMEPASFERVLTSMTLQTEEPVGLLSTAKNLELGLERGDLVLSVNGAPAPSLNVNGTFIMHDAPRVSLVVLRAKKELVITVHLTHAAVTDTPEREHFKESIRSMKELGSALQFQPVTKNGKPSGVMLRLGFLVASDSVAAGDVLRRIDGKAVLSGQDVIAALEGAADKQRFTIELDRLGDAITITEQFQKDGMPLADVQTAITSIKKVSEIKYEIPRATVDALISDPMAMAKGARIVPALENGQPSGFKLYAIRSSSIYTALGLQNGDTLKKVNGLELTTAEKALEAYSKMSTATTIELEIVRRGTSIKITYVIK